jgi:hypothetical protein
MTSMLNKISVREFNLLLVGIGAVITSAAVAGIVVPQFNDWRTATLAVETQSAASLDAMELEKNLQESQARIDKLRYLLHGDMANLPVRQVQAYIIGRLQKISWQNKVELVSVEPTTGEQVQIFREILFKVQLVGEYDNLYRWLWEARNELGFVVVKEYGLSRHDNNDDNPQLAAMVSLASYRVEQ